MTTSTFGHEPSSPVESIPSVDVISIARNHQSGLRRTLASVDGQDWPSTSLYVVDGASTDGTAHMLAEFSPCHPMAWTSEPDNGIYDAMNKGWQRGRGDLVLFMNAGDTFSHSAVVRSLAEAWRDEH